MSLEGEKKVTLGVNNSFFFLLRLIKKFARLSLIISFFHDTSYIFVIESGFSRKSACHFSCMCRCVCTASTLVDRCPAADKSPLMAEKQLSLAN